MNDMKLDGQVALVTGGGRGIGAAICRRLASAGAHVVINYNSSAAGAQACAEAIEAAGGTAQLWQADVRSQEAVEAMIQGICDEKGRLDILVNNAGVVRDTLLMVMKDDQWRDVLETNLFGAAHCIRAVGQTMMLQRSGSIINISSIAAQRPNRGQANYAASKGGVEALTRAMASELGRKGVRVNAIAPGMIVTDMSERVREEAGKEIKKRILLRRFGAVEEIASAVHFLASPAASYITGQVLTVDGGLSLG